MEIEFNKPRLSDKKVMVRFDEGDYETIEKLAKANKEGKGQIVRAIIRNYFKSLKHDNTTTKGRQK